MSAVKPKVILHIGQHKTGSKALQSYLALNADKLRERGILYPLGTNRGYQITAYSNSHFLCYVLARHEAMMACGENAAAGQFWSAYGQYCTPYTTLDQLLHAFETERMHIGAHTIIISAEDLFDMQSAHEVHFSTQWVSHAAHAFHNCAARLGWEPEIAVYLRRPDHLLNAHYAQFIKGDGRNTLDFETFSKAFEPRLDSLGILKIWAAVFRPEHLHVRPYEHESLPGGILPDFFEHLLGFLPGCDWAQVPSNLESSNITPGRAYIDLMREINIRISKNLPAPAREAVLQSAFTCRPTNAPAASWLSPAARYRLTNHYRKDYQEISKHYCKLADHDFFTGEWPQASEDTAIKPDALSAEHMIGLMQCALEYERNQYRRKLKKSAIKMVLAIAVILVGILSIAPYLNI
jgi:hypothetical protein